MTINEIKDTLCPLFEKYRNKVGFAYLFGSVAKGDACLLSDVDIAVYISQNIRDAYFDVKISLHADICRALKRNDVDIVVLNTAFNTMLIGDIIYNGVVIYDREPDLREDYEVRVMHKYIDFKTHRRAVMGV